MRYVKAKCAEYRQELTYRIYITDCLYYQGENKRLTSRFYDLAFPKKEDKRTGDQIALDVITRLNLKVGNDNE